MTTAISRAWTGKERLAIVFWYYAFLGAIAVFGFVTCLAIVSQL